MIGCFHVATGSDSRQIRRSDLRHADRRAEVYMTCSVVARGEDKDVTRTLDDIKSKVRLVVGFLTRFKKRREKQRERAVVVERATE